LFHSISHPLSFVPTPYDFHSPKHSSSKYHLVYDDYRHSLVASYRPSPQSHPLSLHRFVRSIRQISIGMPLHLTNEIHDQKCHEKVSHCLNLEMSPTTLFSHCHTFQPTPNHLHHKSSLKLQYSPC